MRKGIYALILIALMGVSSANVHGEEATHKIESRTQISEKEAQLNTIEFINNLNISIGDITNYSNDIQGVGENEVYSICWESDEKSLSFWVDTCSGEIMSYSQRIFTEDQGNEDMNREAALELAGKIVKELYPDIGKDYRVNDYKESYHGGSDNVYEFEFYKFVNDIPYLDEGVRLRINKFNGELMDIYPFCSEDIGEFPEIKNIKSKEYAYNTLRKNANSNLVYRSYTYDGKLSLIYAYDHSRPASIDAITGGIIEFNPNSVVDEKVSLKGKEREDYVSEGMKNLNSRVLSDVEAEKRLKSVAENFINKYATFMRIEKYQEYNPNGNQIVWSGILEFQGEILAIIDMDQYGNIKNISRQAYNDIDKQDKDEEFRVENLYKKAVDIIIKYMPNKLKDIDLTAYCTVSNVYDEMTPIPCLEIRFPKVINGIRVIGENLTITFTDNNGSVAEIQDYMKEIEDSIIAENIISKEEAIDKYFTKITNVLCYKNCYDANGDYLGVRLIYKLDTNVGIRKFPTAVDAITGEFLDMNGNSK